MTDEHCVSCTISPELRANIEFDTMYKMVKALSRSLPCPFDRAVQLLNIPKSL